MRFRSGACAAWVAPGAASVIMGSPLVLARKREVGVFAGRAQRQAAATPRSARAARRQSERCVRRLMTRTWYARARGREVPPRTFARSAVARGPSMPNQGGEQSPVGLEVLPVLPVQVLFPPPLSWQSRLPLP